MGAEMMRLSLAALLAFSLASSVLLAADEPGGDRHIQRQADVVQAVGLVRYFHPHEATEVVDWNSVLLQGFALADAESSDPEFAGALAELLGGVGAGIAHFAPGDEVAEPAALDCGPIDAPVRWVHRGFGAEPVANSQPIYVSRRSASGRLEADTEIPSSAAIQMLPARQMRGQKLQFSARVRLIDPGEAALMVVVLGPGGEMRSFENMADRPITNQQWTSHAIDFEVAADAEQIVLGVVAIETARAEFRNIALQQMPMADDAEPETLLLNMEGWMLGSPLDLHQKELSFEEGEVLISLLPLESEIATADIDRFMPADAPNVSSMTFLDGSTLQVPLVLCDQPSRLDESDREHLAAEFAEVDLIDLPAPELARLDIAVLWPVMRHFYPYQELVDDWADMLFGALAQAADVANRDAHRRLIKRMLVPLRDGHVFVSDRHPSARRDMAWLPISLHAIDGELVVGNSRHAELRPGDRVTGIDGEPAAAWIESRYEEVSGSSQLRMYEVRREFLEGPRDEARRLVLDRAGESLEISLVHELDESLPLHPHAPTMHLPDGVVYVDLTAIENDEFTEVLPDLVEAIAVIFEVRGYPTAAAVPLLSHLLERPDKKEGWMRTLVARAPNGDLVDAERFEWSLQPHSPRIEAPAFFLTDGGAISFAESILGMVRYNGLGTIVGSNTAGSNGNVISLDLPGQIRIGYTGMRVIGPDGEIFQGVGLPPDVRVYPTIEGVRAGRDEVLERALELLD